VIVLEIGRNNNIECGYFSDSIGFLRELTENHSPKPIPLTEEWFLKLGFQFVGGWVNGKVLLDSLLYVRDKRTEYVFEYGEGSRITIQHVHQLQNLYFALTGK